MKPLVPHKYFFGVTFRGDTPDAVRVKNDIIADTLRDKGIPFKCVKANFDLEPRELFMVVGDDAGELAARLSYKYSQRFYWGVRHDNSFYAVDLADGSIRDVGYLKGYMSYEPEDESFWIHDLSTGLKYFVD